MFNSKPKHSYSDLFEGILIGGSLAAMTTFLFGTRRGKEFQKELMHKYKMLKNKADHMREKIEKAVNSPAAKKVKRKAKALKTKVRKTIRKAANAKTAKRSKVHL